jgi:uncharacterized protein (TIGR02246 family)
MKRLSVGAMLIAVFASLAYGQTQSAGVRQAVEENNKKLVAALNRGDAAATAAIYATDGRAFPPNSHVVEGRQNIQTLWAGFISGGLKLLSLSTVDIESSGNIAVETGRFVVTVPTAGGTVTDEGKYIVVWKRQGRSWKILRDIWNSDNPMQQ